MMTRQKICDKVMVKIIIVNITHQLINDGLDSRLYERNEQYEVNY